MKKCAEIVKIDVSVKGIDVIESVLEIITIMIGVMILFGLFYSGW